MDAKPPDGTEAVEKKSDETVGSNASTIVNIEEDITAVTITENVENIRSVSRKEPRIVDLTLSRNNLEDDVIVKPEPKVYINLGNFENEEEEKRTRWEPIHAYYSYGQPGQYPGGGGGYWGGQQQPYQAPPYQAPPYQAPPYQAQSSPAPQYDQHHGYQSGGPHMWGAPTEQYFEYDPKSRNRYVKMIFLITFLALLYVTVFSIATRYFSVTHRFLRSILGFGIFIMAILDTREGVTSHWSDPSTLGARATFRSDTRPAVLVLTKLRPEDSGQYRCRVDFIKSPTKNTRLNLTVLIPPERLIVLDQDGNEIHGGIIGPYDEGSEVNLTCIAVGGRPTARVSWWKAHALLANSEARATASFRLQRSDLSTDITCQAVTDPSITPVSEALTIDVNLRPLWVRLQGGKRPLVAGQSTELVCQAVGARPKPVISWWKGGNKLKTVRETISTDGNITSSILTFVPAIEDAGRVISCRAVQPSIPHSTHEDGWKMEIQHLPVVKLELGANLDASKVVEGSDVYLDCRVRANPWHNHIYFSHNGVTVKAGPGVLLANQSLVLQKVSRKAAGAYVCTARNSLGEGSSERLVLDVKYTPTCKSTQPTVLRAARGEVIEIECDLDANPRETMSFSWWFNSSAHSKHELTTSTMNAAHNIQGTFLYMVNTSSDYGWVQCAGTNSVGRQIKPCLFHILPADKPSSVKACEITNVTYDSLTLNCTPGHDGGIRQFFLLQVFDMGTGLLLRNVSSEDPEFEVTGLSTTNPLSVSVRAYNRKGSSEPLTLTSMLLKFPERHTAQVPVRVELTTVLIVVLISVGVIAAMTAVSAAIFCCRYCNKRDNKNEKDKRQQDETSNIPLTGTKESESVDSLDKNPDIIPLDGKISDSCSNKSSTTDYSSIRPLISKNQSDKYDHPPNCDRYYDHNIDQCNQYIQIRPVEYRVRPNYQPNMQMTNLGPSIQSIGPMTSMGMMGECQRQPYDKVYEDWLKYKNALPLNTSGLLPAEQLMPPELYATPPPPSIYSNPSRNPLNLAQMPELDRYHLEPRSLMAQDSRSCSNSPPVRFNTDNTVYFSKTMLERPTNTLPHLKPRINGNQELKPSATKAIDTNIEQMKVSKECG